MEAAKVFEMETIRPDGQNGGESMEAVNDRPLNAATHANARRSQARVNAEREQG